MVTDAVCRVAAGQGLEGGHQGLHLSLALADGSVLHQIRAGEGVWGMEGVQATGSQYGRSVRWGGGRGRKQNEARIKQTHVHVPARVHRIRARVLHGYASTGGR